MSERAVRDRFTHTPGRRLTRRGALVLAGSAAFVAACGGGDKSSKETKPGAESAPGGTPATGAAASPAAQGKVGGTLRYPLEGISSGDPPTIFPFENITYTAQHPSSLHYSRLLRGQS